ncbi:MAG TPA: hypothetical protein VE196_04560, partial [Pseudonocardiaceae bacterium]|nr:hypothetical protein [Pseudonocardiaceae bacterium]
LASSADNGSLLSVARSELPRLTHGWRALLASHAPDTRGRCPECSSRWRPRAALCSVWRAAHEHLVHAESVSGAVSPKSVPAISGARRSAARQAVSQLRPPTSLFPAGAAAAR